MAITVYTKEMVAEKYAAMELASQAVVDALNEGKPEKEMKPLKDAAKNAQAEYNTANEGYYYLALVDTYGANALEQGIKVFNLPGAKKASQRQDKKSGRFVSKISDDKKATIDLLTFMDTVGVEQFHEADWYTRCQKFAFIIANAINKELGEDPAFSYAVDEAAKAFEFAPDANPSSANSGRKALQSCVDGIVFIPSEKDPEKNSLCVGKKHWHFINRTMTRKGKGKGEVAVSNTAGVAALIAEVVSIILDPANGDVRLIADEG